MFFGLVFWVVGEWRGRPQCVSWCRASWPKETTRASSGTKKVCAPQWPLPVRSGPGLTRTITAVLCCPRNSERKDGDAGQQEGAKVSGRTHRAEAGEATKKAGAEARQVEGDTRKEDVHGPRGCSQVSTTTALAQ